MEIRLPTEQQKASLFAAVLCGIGLVLALVWTEPAVMVFVLGFAAVMSPLVVLHFREAVLWLRCRGRRFRATDSSLAMLDGDEELWMVRWDQVVRVERRKWFPSEFGMAYLVDRAGRRFELEMPWRAEFRPKETGQSFWEDLERRVGAPPPIRSWLLDPSKRRAKVMIGVGCLMVLSAPVIAQVLGYHGGADREISLDETFWRAVLGGGLNVGFLLVILGWACWPRVKR